MHFRIYYKYDSSFPPPVSMTARSNSWDVWTVIFWFQDYYNYINSSRVYLPPLPTKYAFAETPRDLQLPKTFTTRKGALLLFSEDFALKAQQTERAQLARDGHANSLDDLNLKTVDDLARSILAYGGHVSPTQMENCTNNLTFCCTPSASCSYHLWNTFVKVPIHFNLNKVFAFS